MLRIAQASCIIISTLVLAGNALAVEEAKYKVLREEAGFELRQYDAHILAETTVDGEFGMTTIFFDCRRHLTDCSK